MIFDTVIIGGGLAGLVAGIELQNGGRPTVIISSGQNALHFFSGTFESINELSPRILELFSGAGIKLHGGKGLRMMPLGTFKDAAISLEDVSIFSEAAFCKKALVVNFAGYLDFLTSFISDGLEKHGVECRKAEIDLPALNRFHDFPDEMRSVQIASIVDTRVDDVISSLSSIIKDEDAVILPQVFGLYDDNAPERIRQAIPIRVVFAGTLPPSVPGIRIQALLKHRFEALGGTFLAGDEVIKAQMKLGKVISVATRNLDSHYIEADNFILATGGYYSKGLQAAPHCISESVFGLDVNMVEDMKYWFDDNFMAEQPYMGFGVNTDADLHAMLNGEPVMNLFAIGSVLGSVRPGLGSGAGLAIRSAFAVVDHILDNKH